MLDNKTTPVPCKMVHTR